MCAVAGPCLFQPTLAISSAHVLLSGRNTMIVFQMGVFRIEAECCMEWCGIHPLGHLSGYTCGVLRIARAREYVGLHTCGLHWVCAHCAGVWLFARMVCSSARVSFLVSPLI